MLKFAWAYQGGGDGMPYPVQTIDARIQNERPATRLAMSIAHVAIRSRPPATRTEGEGLVIFKA